MTGHSKWSDVRAKAIAEGRLTEEGMARARVQLQQQIIDRLADDLRDLVVYWKGTEQLLEAASALNGLLIAHGLDTESAEARAAAWRHANTLIDEDDPSEGIVFD